jgi:hypothetical protein
VRFFLNLEKEDEGNSTVAEAKRILHLMYTVQSVQVENIFKTVVAHNKTRHYVRKI